MFITKHFLPKRRLLLRVVIFGMYKITLESKETVQINSFLRKKRNGGVIIMLEMVILFIILRTFLL